MKKNRVEEEQQSKRKATKCRGKELEKELTGGRTGGRTKVRFGRTKKEEMDEKR